MWVKLEVVWVETQKNACGRSPASAFHRSFPRLAAVNQGLRGSARQLISAEAVRSTLPIPPPKSTASCNHRFATVNIKITIASHAVYIRRYAVQCRIYKAIAIEKNCIRFDILAATCLERSRFNSNCVTRQVARKVPDCEQLVQT